MNCSKIQSLLSAYLDGEVTGEEQLAIRRHLKDCKGCSAEHESLQTTKRLICSLSVRQPRADLEQMILDVLAEEEHDRSRRSPIMAWWLTLPLNRRMQYAAVFALGAVTLAAVRIAPVLMAPSHNQPLSAMIAQSAQPSPSAPSWSTVQRPLSPVGDVSFIYNPADNVPASAGRSVIPINMTNTTGSGQPLNH